MKYTKLIQWHSLTPPLCKAPEAAVQRRCGDRLWRWKGCQNGNNPVGTLTEACANLQPLSHLTVPAPLTQGSLYGVRANLSGCPYTGEPIGTYKLHSAALAQASPCVRRRKLPCSGGVGTALAVEGL